MLFADNFILLNPRTYTQSHTPTVVQGGGGGLGGPGRLIYPLLSFLYVAVFETILPSVESLSSSLQDEVNVMGGGAAGGLRRHQTWSPSWILVKIRN